MTEDQKTREWLNTANSKDIHKAMRAGQLDHVMTAQPRPKITGTPEEIVHNFRNGMYDALIHGIPQEDN